MFNHIKLNIIFLCNLFNLNIILVLKCASWYLKLYIGLDAQLINIILIYMYVFFTGGKVSGGNCPGETSLLPSATAGSQEK